MLVSPAPMRTTPLAAAAIALALAAPCHALDEPSAERPLDPRVLSEDREWTGLSLGSKPGELVEAAAILWLAHLKSSSDFGFGNHGRGAGDPKYVHDLGMPADTLVGGGALAVSLGPLGWIGGELLSLSLSSDAGTVRAPRRLRGIELDRGDLLRSDAAILWGRVHYGYELRWRFRPLEDLPIDLYVSPTLGMGVYDLDVHVRRIAPSPTGDLGGSMTAWVVAPGVRAGIEVLDALRAGVDVEWLPGVGGELRVSTPHVEEWERLRVFAGVRVFALEATVGYRYLNTSVDGGGRNSDIKLRGLDFSLGVRF